MELSSGNFKEKNPFRVPDGYFDHLPEQVMGRIRKGEGKETVRVVPLRRKIHYAAAVAAAVVILLGGYLFLQQQSTPRSEGGPDKNVMAFVLTDEMDEQILWDYLEQEGIAADTLQQPEEESMIIDYLLQEGVDESLLAELY